MKESMDPPVTPERSDLMRRVRGKGSAPEMAVRRTVHRLGYRFRLHHRSLPGRPDLVLPRWHTVIFVHGCFWHRHSKCRRATVPKIRASFWADKFAKNRERDRRVVKQLRAAGWRVVVIWECETLDPARLTQRISAVLSTMRLAD